MIPRSAPARGFAIAYVLIILAVLFLLSFILIQSMTHEAAFSFKQLEKTVAQFAAEMGVEHAIYILQQHSSSDYKTLGMEKSTLEINKKFGTSDEFEMDIPVNCTDDSRFAKLAAVDMNDKLAELKATYKLDATPKIESLKILYKTLDTIDSSADRFLKFGRLTIRCTGSYGTSKMTVDSIRRVEIYRTMMIAPDWQFVVTGTNQKIVGRRTTSGLGGWTTNYIAQYLIVNNGWPTQADMENAPAVAAKIYGKDLTIELNDYIPDPYKFSLFMVGPVGGGIISALSSGCDMMYKLANEKIDPKIKPDHEESQLVKYRANKFLGLDISNNPISNIADLISGQGGSVVEWDINVTQNVLGAIASQLFSNGKGGTRGNIDLTGLPGNPNQLAVGLFEQITGFFSRLFGKHTNYTLNELYGKILRKYGYYKKDLIGSLLDLAGPIGDVIKGVLNSAPTVKADEPYVFNMKTDNPDEGLFKPYDADVYKRMAGHGNGRLYVTADDFTDHKLAAGNLLWWNDIGAKDFNNVCWFFGYADSYTAMDETSWAIFHWWPDRDAFEATRLDSRFALNVNGVYFVDGNAFVEGYYKGRGAIVATGNIIIGGSIMRHPDDGTFDAAVASWLGEGTNNMLQLVALGTRSPENGKPTGKIIIAPHKYPAGMFEGGIIRSLFRNSNDSQIKIDAGLWAKNGITVSTEARDDKNFWELWGKEDTFLSINGNLIIENTCSSGADPEKTAYETWPDKVMINRFQRWIEILGMMKTENFVNLNLFPQPDQYLISGGDGN